MFYRFGSMCVGTRTGIIFNDEMDDLSSPHAKNIYNVEPSEANFIMPGKRPLSSMTPIIVRNNSGYVTQVIGASGGSHIPSAVALVSL